jgi:hypothetical protein
MMGITSNSYLLDGCEDAYLIQRVLSLLVSQLIQLDL